MSDPSRRLRRHFTAASQRRFQRDGKRGGAYVARASGRHYCLGETSVLAESSDVYGVLQSSQVLLQVHGAKNACHYQASGWMMQRFGALAAQRRIGGCILGVTPAEDTLCSMAIGYARAEDEPAFDVPALTVSMTQAIRRHLARRLPDYMLPQHITLIPEIPLSNNGKVDTSRLPKVVKHSECLAPRSDDEIRMRRLWAELLDKREERIGCDQSFFTQGEFASGYATGTQDQPRDGNRDASGRPLQQQYDSGNGGVGRRATLWQRQRRRGAVMMLTDLLNNLKK